MSRLHHDQNQIFKAKKEGLVIDPALMTAGIFLNIRRNLQRQTKLAEGLAQAIGAPLDLPSYGIDFLPSVQEYYDKVINM
jgi:hypothetical protein